MEQQRDRKESTTGQPLQRISWAEKNAKDKQWWKDNIDYRITNSGFNRGNNWHGKFKMLYDVYNHRFPMSWFKHVTDPLNATEAAHRAYPAKIRPTTMLRTNIDLLMGEYPLRPFVYGVVNMGEDAYNSYLESLQSQIENNLQEHFVMMAQSAMKAAGQEMQEIPMEEQIELPESVRERYTASYKDNLAIRGQKWLKRTIREHNVRQKFLKMFKDWLITGYCYSYKNLEFNQLVYDHVPPWELDYDRNQSVEFVEDGEWVVRQQFVTFSDFVDRFYDELKEADYIDLETRAQWTGPAAMFNYLNSMWGDNAMHPGRIPLWHVQWKGKKELKYYSYTDPLTGQEKEVSFDEDTVDIDGSLTYIRSEWVNEVYEGWRGADNLHLRMRAVPVQRNEMNNFSKCKGSYNGRAYSNTFSDNISVLEMGLPSAVMYMITNYILEKTIAKSKGKIVLVDQNSIPQKDGWNDEKFFYYADAMGYMLVNRNQLGVDKSFNQYQVLDMTLFQHIKELIVIRDSFKQEWDDLLGVNPQRKAQVGAGDGLGTTEIALNRSAVITAMIFTLFEEFTERELQGLLDFSKFTNINGIRGIYNLDDFDAQLLSIDPNSYSSAELGVFVKYSMEEMQILREYKSQVQAMIQNGVKQSTILEIQKANNLEELMARLKRIEEIEAEEAEMRADSEADRQAMLEEQVTRRETLLNELKIDQINAEWNRRDQNEMIKGEYSLFSFGGDGDNNDNGVPDANEIADRVMKQQELFRKQQLENQKLNQKDKEHKDKMSLEMMKLQDKERDRKSREKIAADKNKVALRNKVTGEK